MSVFSLLIMFFKIGLFTFGGGYAMLPLLRTEVVNKHRLMEEDELLDIYAIGQCTPGIIAINVATFVGYKQKGVLGAICATLGMILPSLIIITLVATILKNYMHNRYVSYAFAGIRVCVVALIADVVYDLWRKNVKLLSDKIIFVLAVLLLVFFNVGAMWIVIISAVTAWGLSELKRYKRK
ncbi:MAG: chromate transporter [Alphaproteobacteria bacterium]|nr:chromate transporter [Alphaproteobacteria bacterium]